MRMEVHGQGSRSAWKTRIRRPVQGNRPGQAGKMLVPLLSVLAVLSMGVGGVAIYLKIQESEKRQAVELERDRALADNNELQAKLEEAIHTRSKVEGELSTTRRELVQSKDELAKAVEAQVTLSKSIEDREWEISRLTKDLEQGRSQSQQAAEQLAQLQRERDGITQHVADLERAKGELESKLIELSANPTVELDKVVVGDEAALSAGLGTLVPASTGSTISQDGQVVVINREYDFIVMNLGKNHGLSIGQEFQVVRGNEVLGKVKVEKVYDELSAAAILPGSRKDTIREGDLVRAL